MWEEMQSGARTSRRCGEEKGAQERIGGTSNILRLLGASFQVSDSETSPIPPTGRLMGNSGEQRQILLLCSVGNQWPPHYIGF